MADLRLEVIGDLTKLRRLRAEANRGNILGLNITVDALEEMVLENLSGKILQEKTGELKRRVKKLSQTREGDTVVGGVVIEPADAKAYALEYGGKEAYVIQVGGKGYLANEAEDFFSRKDVVHPPSKAYGYLRHAAEDMAEELPPSWLEVFEEILR